jgi:hypothetical protein
VLRGLKRKHSQGAACKTNRNSYFAEIGSSWSKADPASDLIKNTSFGPLQQRNTPLQTGIEVYISCSTHWATSIEKKLDTIMCQLHHNQNAQIPLIALSVMALT